MGWAQGLYYFIIFFFLGVGWGGVGWGWRWGIYNHNHENTISDTNSNKSKLNKTWSINKLHVNIIFFLPKLEIHICNMGQDSHFHDSTFLVENCNVDQLSTGSQKLKRDSIYVKWMQNLLWKNNTFKANISLQWWNVKNQLLICVLEIL